jgi:hypothetical protein
MDLYRNILIFLLPGNHGIYSLSMNPVCCCICLPGNLYGGDLCLFGLKEKFGFYAVLIQMIPFVILHNGKPELETFGAIAGGIALGILALRTKSFYYCVSSSYWCYVSDRFYILH